MSEVIEKRIEELRQLEQEHTERLNKLQLEARMEENAVVAIRGGIIELTQLLDSEPSAISCAGCPANEETK